MGLAKPVFFKGDADFDEFAAERWGGISSSFQEIVE